MRRSSVFVSFDPLSRKTSFSPRKQKRNTPNYIALDVIDVGQAGTGDPCKSVESTFFYLIKYA